GGEPNGHWKGTRASLVPLIRMSNTVFDAGSRNPEDILKEVDHGWYVTGHRIPSIAESRENFRISARRVYEIENGQLGRLYRAGARARPEPARGPRGRGFRGPKPGAPRASQLHLAHPLQRRRGAEVHGVVWPRDPRGLRRGRGQAGRLRQRAERPRRGGGASR